MTNQETKPVPADATYLEVIPGDYYLRFDESPFVVLRLGGTLNHRSANFSHPKIVARQPAVFEFKHYRQSGSKFWTSAAGFEFYFVIRKSDIHVVKKNGYSWPKVIINGAEVTLNVSGGTSENHTWTDKIGRIATTSVNMPIKTLKAIAAVALTAEEAKAAEVNFNLREITEEHKEQFIDQYCKSTILNTLKVGMPVFLKSGWGIPENVKPMFIFESKAMRKIKLRTDNNLPVYAPYEAVDWVETAKINFQSVGNVSQFNKLGSIA